MYILVLVAGINLLVILGIILRIPFLKIKLYLFNKYQSMNKSNKTESSSDNKKYQMGTNQSEELLKVVQLHESQQNKSNN